MSGIGNTLSPRAFAVSAFVVMFIGVGFIVAGIWSYFDGQATKDWPTTTASVTMVEVVNITRDEDRRETYEYRATMEYTVGDKTFAIGYETTIEPAIGSTQTIRYDPTNPDNARPGAGSGGGTALGAAVIGGLGAALSIVGILLFRRSRRGPITLPGFSRNIELGG